MTQQIAAVWRDLDVQNRIRWKKISDRRANFCFGRQYQQAGCIFAQAELDRTAKHSFRLNAAQCALSNLDSVRQFRAWKGERNFVADFVICCAADDLALRAASIVRLANGEPICVRMTRGRGDLRNDHVVDRRAARLYVFGFDSGSSQEFGNVFRMLWKIDKLAQPVNRKFHFFWMSCRAESRHLKNEIQRLLDFARNDKIDSRELFQKPQIILREEPDIRNFE